jgi:hypothetical protein
MQVGLVLSVGGWFSEADWIAPLAIPLVTAALVLLVVQSMRDGRERRTASAEEKSPILGELASN